MAAKTRAKYRDNVFLNVPFDGRYQPLFRALIFAIHDCGFQARCSLESSDGSVVRIQKLYSIIGQCPYGLHDISRTTLDGANRLPRFNMPLELGIFLGAKKYGNSAHRLKNCMILDRDRYRYQKFCSDLAGQDIRAHNNQIPNAIAAVRDWLSAARRHHLFIPGGRRMAQRYKVFQRFLPKACRVHHVRLSELTFLNYRTLVVGWLRVNP